MSLKDTINDAVKASMKAKEKEKTATLRLITSAIKQIEVDERRELSDDDVIAVLTKMVKQRRESIDQFQKGGRDDLIAKEEAELVIIQEYLPEQLSEAEIDELSKCISGNRHRINVKGTDTGLEGFEMRLVHVQHLRDVH